MARRIADLRITYESGELLESDLRPTPLEQFRAWLDDAVTAGLVDPNGMVLSTVDAQGQPFARSVLLKEADARGFSFFSYAVSAKAGHLAQNPRVALLFPWYSLHRQVIVVGTAEPLPQAEIDEYFASRPHTSQVGATISRQSAVIDGRTDLEARYEQALARYPEGARVPRPDVFTGWLVRPVSVEFWLGRRSRLHDRLRFTWTPDGPADLSSAAWTLERLSP